jgi:hypothetical protein
MVIAGRQIGGIRNSHRRPRRQERKSTMSTNTERIARRAAATIMIAAGLLLIAALAGAYYVATSPALLAQAQIFLPVVEAGVPHEIGEAISETVGETPGLQLEPTPAATVTAQTVAQYATRRPTPQPRATPRPARSYQAPAYTTSSGYYCSPNAPASWRNPGCNGRQEARATARPSRNNNTNTSRWPARR